MDVVAGLLAADLVVTVLAFVVLDRIATFRLRPRRLALGAAAALGVANVLVPLLFAALATPADGASDAASLGALCAALLAAHAATLLGARHLARSPERPAAAPVLLLALGSVVATLLLSAAAVWMTFPSFDRVALPSSFH